MKNNKLFVGLVVIAVLIKIFLFAFSAIRTPDMKIEADSGRYLDIATVLYSKGAFATLGNGGTLQPEVFRTPGYPLFLGLLHDAGKIPLDGVIFLQVLLTLVTAWLIYVIAARVEVGIAALSVVIFLFDIPSTVWSLRIMTESLFTLLLAFMIWGFISYLKKADLKLVIFSALALVLATYVRPISYFLGIPIAGFIVYANAPRDLKKSLVHVMIFVAVVFGLLGPWSVRNYHCCQTTAFASVSKVNEGVYAIAGSYAQERYPQKSGVTTAAYYGEIALRSLGTMMFNPGSWKYFRDPVLAAIGKVLAYLLMIFWMIGLISGIFRIGRNIYYQFFLVVGSYFILATVCNVGLVGNERFRVVIMPCIAMISAYGWRHLWPGKNIRS